MLINFFSPLGAAECETKNASWHTARPKCAYYSKFHSSYWYYIFFPLLTSSGIPRFWMNSCQTGLIRSHNRRSPPHPFWALRISCAKLLICLVTSQCFLHGTEGKISTLLRAVNHSALPLIHWYDHYSIRLHSNWPVLGRYNLRLGDCFHIFIFFMSFFFQQHLL